MTTLLIMFVGAGVLLVLLALPLLFEKVPPNGLYGFRIAPATEGPRTWYPTNKHSARRLIAAGLSTIAAAVGLRFVPGISLDVYALGCLAVVVVVLGVGFVQTVVFMNALARREQQEAP